MNVSFYGNRIVLVAGVFKEPLEQFAIIVNAYE